MRQILGCVLIAIPFLFIWLVIPALTRNNWTTYLDGLKITSFAVLVTGIVCALVFAGVFLVTGRLE